MRNTIFGIFIGLLGVVVAAVLRDVASITVKELLYISVAFGMTYSLIILVEIMIEYVDKGA